MNKVIFNEIQALKRQLIPTGKMILFGSQERGNKRKWLKNNTLIQELVIVREKAADNIKKVVLFGSRARGDAQTDSDWDLLILLNKSAGFIQDFDMYGYPFIECGMKNNEDVNVHLYSFDEWESYKDKSLFYYNVNKEGVEI